MPPLFKKPCMKCNRLFLGMGAYCKECHDEYVQGKDQRHSESLGLGRCPRCNRFMIKKFGKHGPFVTCSGYPLCRYQPPRTPEQEATRDRDWYRGQWARLSKEQIERVPYCEVCGATKDLTADHVVPRSLAGGLRTLCRPCNAKKGAASG
jgi:5-methylcytosine-specific restriction endonuclease McrA